MHTKTAMLGLAVLLAMGGLYVASHKASPMPEVPVDPMAPMETGMLIERPELCPSAVNATVLTFEDTLTNEVKAVIDAFDETLADGEFTEPNKPRKIQYLDLNNDGKQDFVTLYTGENWCGSLGCSVDVFIQDDNGGYAASQAFYTTAGQSMVLESTANGYRQMIAPVQDSGLPNEQHLWEWTGEKYETEAHCLRE
jgi:hypothetical protein